MISRRGPGGAQALGVAKTPVEDHGNPGCTGWFRNKMIKATGARYIEIPVRLPPEVGMRSHLAVEG